MPKMQLHTSGAPLLVVVLLTSAVPCMASDMASIDQRTAAISQVVDMFEPRVARMRLFLAEGPKRESPRHESGIDTTGVLIGNGGWLLTSDHGLDTDLAGAYAVLDDGSQVGASLVARDYPRRLALFRLESTPPYPLPPVVSPSGIRPGETAIALGRVLLPHKATLSVGIVSAVDRLSGRAIQTDARTSPTNYGGPLLSLRGELLGIVVPLAPEGVRGESWYDSGIGFAVPMAQIERRLAQLERGESIYAGTTGITLVQGNPYRDPPIVERVEDPATQAGLLPGDLLRSVGIASTESIARWERAVGRYDAGAKIVITYERAAATHRRELRLTRQETSPSSQDPPTR